MNAAPETTLRSTDAEQVSELLRAMPRLSAPYELTRSVRSELFRERRHAQPQAFYSLWPAAAAVQLVLLAGLCALYFFATPPTAIVVSDSTVSQEQGAAGSLGDDTIRDVHPQEP